MNCCIFKKYKKKAYGIIYRKLPFAVENTKECFIRT